MIVFKTEICSFKKRPFIELIINSVAQNGLYYLFLDEFSKNPDEKIFTQILPDHKKIRERIRKT